ncbi:cytidine deaminase [Vespertiliibacter pulmonis]|uniref:Cytidine deaminase n=1 Tax=Vespertiliibacter pulmonis TaxID=1443036 RepID=A0A3N4VU30_9PAST|nr:cytidine deaminase [Vespertiliibacter pulmonis]RPE82671.1 cytidine deaminase [Vespertiliibacter pulmonis]
MENQSTIQQRLMALDISSNPAVLSALRSALEKQKFHAQFSAEQVQQWCEEFQLSTVALALLCLPLAACYALAPVSNFYVGAIAIGKSGKFYFGANQEFANDAIQQSVHAEQSAISHALVSGEIGITDMIVNYTPCGHCRQFMNELNTAETLNIHLPHSQNNLLHSYLPDAFGPKDLNVNAVLFDNQITTDLQNSEVNDPLVQQAINSAYRSYAPYSQAKSGVALQVGDQIITGQYAENAAFNPSFLALQSALNHQRLRGLDHIPVRRVVLAEQKSVLSHRNITESLARHYLGLAVEYISLATM